MLLLLRAIILTFEYLSVLKSSAAQSLIFANIIDEVLEHCTDAHGIKNRYSISKISRWKLLPVFTGSLSALINSKPDAANLNIVCQQRYHFKNVLDYKCSFHSQEV
jgi:hypothetical protein